MSDLTDAEYERLARAAQKAGWPDNETGEWCLPSDWDLGQPPTPWHATIVEIFAELDAMGYSLSRRVPHKGQIQ